MIRFSPQSSALSVWLRFALAVLLLASHGLLLAHSGEHLFDTGNPVCDVCTAGQAFSAGAVDTASAEDIRAGFCNYVSAPIIAADLAAPFPSDPARAPPVIL